MQFRALRLKFRRRWRKRQRRVEDLGLQTEDKLDKHLLSRLWKLKSVWRFTVSWILLFVIIAGCLVVQIEALSGYYQKIGPLPGGIYTEGVVGNFTNANPLYAVDGPNAAVSRLIFAGLFRYDNDNKLVGNLADGWTVDSTGRIYTVHLRPNLVWQDGLPLNASDVAYTYKVIQNPDAQSPLLSSFRGVQVDSKDSRTIVFTLPNPLSSFPDSLTNGIVPQHILGKLQMADLRSASFNTADPVGAGPFQLNNISVKGIATGETETQLSFVPFAKYWAGEAKLKTFIFHTFVAEEDMLKAYRQQQLTAMAGLDRLPADIASSSNTHIYELPLTAETMVFFKNSNTVLSDVKVRKALVESASPADIIKQLGYFARPVKGPLLDSQLGYNAKYDQQTNDVQTANKLLDEANWKVGKNGIRSKDGLPLGFDLYAPNTAEYKKVSKMLQKQWRGVGVNARIVLQDTTDFQSTLSNHSYDAVLYGISVGVDPDVFIYWDSSQADVRTGSRLNLSEYKNKTADQALEAGRTRMNDQLRAVKYQAFLEAWQKDVPALGLYQPRYLYVANRKIYGLNDGMINNATDRFNNVNNWMIRTGMVTNPRTNL